MLSTAVVSFLLAASSVAAYTQAWTGGTAPYFLSIVGGVISSHFWTVSLTTFCRAIQIPGGQPSAAALESFPETSDTSVTWTVDIAAGTSISLSLKDSTGTIVYSDQVTIQAGTTTSCVGASSAASGSSTSAAAAGGSSSSAAAAGASSTTSKAASTGSSSAAAGSSSSSAASNAKTTSSSSGAATSGSSTTSSAAASSTSSTGAASGIVAPLTAVAAVALGAVALL
ncbi:hypothetical protein MNV49_003438 [Pseudohyphozyma bogoriensis]|nr:hypothetical protein MNV49_003438 [Pseudohyphozyma bogoriensis]